MANPPLKAGRGGTKRRPSLHKLTYTRVWRGREVVCPWPPKRTYTLHPKTKNQMEIFRQVQWAYKLSSPLIQTTVAAAVKGTPLMPRDLFLKTISGRLHSFVMPDGTKVFSLANLKDISHNLDIVTQSEGFTILRGSELWEGYDLGKKANVDGGNSFTGPQEFSDGVTITGGDFHASELGVNYFGEACVIKNYSPYDTYPSIQALDNLNNAQGAIYFAMPSDQHMYFDAPAFIFENVAETVQFMTLGAAGATVLGQAVIAKNAQAAIPNDATTSPNKVTVNAILAALRAAKIILP